MCIPYLKNGRNPHILNLSPPLTLDPEWFAPHLAYTIAKMGMSMCVLGMSEELRDDKIAVNALWPRTLIWTAAMKIVAPGFDIMRGCRKPDILADAAYLMLKKSSSEYTGNFAIDDEVGFKGSFLINSFNLRLLPKPDSIILMNMPLIQVRNRYKI
jgi:citronellol/citronellal dehydrogenase